MNRNNLAIIVLTGSLTIAGAAAAQMAANALNLPRGRPGYWEVKTAGPNGVTHSHHTCSRGEAPKLNGPYPQFCQVSFTRTPAGIVGDGRCANRGITGSWHVIAQGDFVSHFSTDGVTVMNFPGRPQMTLRRHTEARWVGPCPPGVAPGSGDQP